MLQYERTDVSEGIDVNKPNKLKKKKKHELLLFAF